MKNLSDQDLKSLDEYGNALANFITEPGPKFTPPPPSETGWRPALNPTQQLIYDDPTKFILADGEKGSGKTVGAGLFKLVRHCYENEAMAFVIVTKYNTGDLGVWDDFEKLVLPTFRDGNRYPEWTIDENGQHQPHPRANELMDCGMGLDYMMPTLPFVDVLRRVLEGSGECAEKGWVFLGLSIAGWTFVFFAGMIAAAIALIRRD